MLCNAGRNYLVFHSDGQAYRCQCHLETPLGPIEEIDSWISKVQLDCSITRSCEENHRPEWDRTCRLAADGSVLDRGGQACDPNNEVMTRIQLNGESTRSPEDWCTLFDRLAKRYKKCWHRIEGQDPADFPGIARLVDKISFLGDQLYYVTDFSSRTTRIVDVLSKANPECVHFTGIINPTATNFDEIRFLGRIRLIKERGYSVCAIMPGTLVNLHLFDKFFAIISGKYGIPMAMLPEQVYPESVKTIVQKILEKGNIDQMNERKGDDFSGL